MAMCLRDDETTGRRDTLKNPGVLRRSQSFSVILSHSQSREVVRGCARQLGVRVLHTLSDEINFCQKGLDVVLSRKMTGWGCTWAYIPIQADEGSAADSPLSQKLLGVRVVQQYRR